MIMNEDHISDLYYYYFGKCLIEHERDKLCVTEYGGYSGIKRIIYYEINENYIYRYGSILVDDAGYEV